MLFLSPHHARTSTPSLGPGAYRGARELGVHPDKRRRSNCLHHERQYQPNRPGHGSAELGRSSFVRDREGESQNAEHQKHATQQSSNVLLLFACSARLCREGREYFPQQFRLQVERARDPYRYTLTEQTKTTMQATGSGACRLLGHG